MKARFVYINDFDIHSDVFSIYPLVVSIISFSEAMKASVEHPERTMIHIKEGSKRIEFIPFTTTEVKTTKVKQTKTFFIFILFTLN